MYLKHNQIATFREDFKPELCPILMDDKDDWCLDHDHQSGLVRGVISRNANAMLGKVENYFFGMCQGNKEDLPEVLRRMADYLDFPAMDVLHPVGLTQLTKRFERNLTVKEQRALLSELGAIDEDIECCKNQKQRTAFYRQLLINKHN